MNPHAQSQRLSEVLGALSIDTGQWAFASTEELRAVVVTRARAKGRFDIFVHLQPNLPGIVAELAGCKVSLAAAADPEGAAIVASIDSGGRIAFPDMPPGTYRLGVVPVDGADILPHNLVAERTAVFLLRSLRAAQQRGQGQGHDLVGEELCLPWQPSEKRWSVPPADSLSCNDLRSFNTGPVARWENAAAYRQSLIDAILGSLQSEALPLRWRSTSQRTT
jgi:hypothetical protein